MRETGTLAGPDHRESARTVAPEVPAGRRGGYGFSKFAWIVLFTLPLMVTCLHGLLSPPRDAYLWDTNIYLAGAQSLAGGRGYRLESFVGDPPIGLYPPLQSFLLSRVWSDTRGVDANLSRARALMLVVQGVALGLMLALCLRLGAPLLLASLLTVAVGLNPSWYYSQELFLSDVLFTAICFAVALLWVGRSGPVSNARWFLTGAGLGAACLTRTAALPLLVGAAFVPLRRALGGASWRPFWSLTFPAALALAVVHLSTEGGAGYSANFSAWWGPLGAWQGYSHLLLKNAGNFLSGRQEWKAWWYPLFLLPRWTALRSPRLVSTVAWGTSLMFWAVVVLVVRGVTRVSDRAEKAIALILVAYVASILVAPIATTLPIVERYLLVTVPFVGVWAWRGLPAWRVPWRPAPRIAPLVSLLCFALVVAVSAIAFGQSLRHARWARQSFGTREEIIEWMHRNADPADRLAVGIDQPYFQMAERLGLPLVIDYFDPIPLPGCPIPVVHASQGYAAARFLMLHGAAKRPWLPVGLLSPVMTTSDGAYHLMRVDPAVEAAWRAERGIPAPR